MFDHMDLKLKSLALLVLLIVTDCCAASDKNTTEYSEPQVESNNLLPAAAIDVDSGQKLFSDPKQEEGEEMEEAVEPQNVDNHSWSVSRHEYTTSTAPTANSPSPKLLKKKRKGNHKNSKEIRRKLRKLRRELQSLMSGTTQRKECKRFADCRTDECCLWKGKKRYCRKRPKLGHRCRPSLMPGLGSECPCTIGATCRLVNTGKRMKVFKHKCQLLIKNEPIEMGQSLHRRHKRLQRDITKAALWQTRHSGF